MRDLFDDLFRRDPIDPVEAVRRALRPQLPRRFYRSAGVGEAEGEFRLLLDGRPVKTPARHPLAVPTRALAQAIADEWEAQGERIDPARMPLTRLANSILDGVRTAVTPVASAIAKYLASDLLFYRADVPGLAARQTALWDPILDWAREELGASFVLSEGVVFVEQPAAALAKAQSAVPGDPWRLGALHSMTTLTGSALLALALFYRVRDPDSVWAAAHVDEDWNADTWGVDEEVAARRAARLIDFRAAVAILQALNTTPG